MYREERIWKYTERTYLLNYNPQVLNYSPLIYCDPRSLSFTANRLSSLALALLVVRGAALGLSLALASSTTGPGSSSGLAGFKLRYHLAQVQEDALACREVLVQWRTPVILQLDTDSAAVKKLLEVEDERDITELGDCEVSIPCSSP